MVDVSFCTSAWHWDNLDVLLLWIALVKKRKKKEVKAMINDMYKTTIHAQCIAIAFESFDVVPCGEEVPRCSTFNFSSEFTIYNMARVTEYERMQR